MPKQGSKIKCASCQGELPSDEYWAITRHKKELKSIPCPSCGKPFTIEFIPAKDVYAINKTCSCLLEYGSQLFERQEPKWKKKIYVLCPSCAKKICGSTVVYAELGEDQDG